MGFAVGLDVAFEKRGLTFALSNRKEGIALDQERKTVEGGTLGGKSQSLVELY